MDEIEKTLEALDFEPKIQCQISRPEWTVTGKDLPEGLPPPWVPASCPNPSTGMYLVRVCNCWHDVRAFVRAGTPIEDMQFWWGVLVRRMPLCDAHVAYFRDYLFYPFLCPGCGLHYENVNEILVIERNI